MANIDAVPSREHTTIGSNNGSLADIKLFRGKDRAKTLSFDILYVLGSCQKVTVS